MEFDKELISDIFFNMVFHMKESGIVNNSRTKISELAGAYSKTLTDVGIEYKPENIREDYYNRL